MKSEKKEITFETAIARLEEIVGLLEDGGAPLDEIMSLYTEGAKLTAFCSQKLDKAAQTIERANTKTKAKEEKEDA